MTRPKLVFASLTIAWLVIAAWQVVEHQQVDSAARAALLNRSRDITGTLGLVIRSQRRFGMVSQERLESALGELVKSGELNAIALLNASGEVVVSAGTPIDVGKTVLQTGERWDAQSVTVMNIVDLGSSPVPTGETSRPTIVLPRRDPGQGAERERDRDRERPFPPGTNFPPPTVFSTNDAASTNAMPNWPRFGRPPRMDEKEFKQLQERRGLHGLAIRMSTDAYHEASSRDLWMRWFIGTLATIAVAGVAVAWQNLVKTSELQMRLVRASELNSHLRDMNLAAAGLAHETRNPLNIVRGLAQLISKQDDASPEVRKKSREIVEETDRVTAQLNEFINYSRPREARKTAVLLDTVAKEVVRTLNYDVEEKRIQAQVCMDPLRVEADEQLLRQALFNLVLNAIQAAREGGFIRITAEKRNGNGIVLEVADDGPGVAPEHRGDIFKPYFTTQEKGTGLGLAVVQQIVLAHGWEIQFRPNEPRGAVFQISHIKPA
jgi:signal transduction histidine kinase